MLKINRNSGFKLTFNNGLTISVQFDNGNYCSRSRIKPKEEEVDIESTDAEIAIWDENDNWHSFNGDIVKGYVDANEVAMWIGKVANAANIHL